MAKPKPKTAQTIPNIDSAAALDRVLKMMAIRGGSGHEESVAEFLTEQLRGAGIPANAIATDDAHRRSPNGGNVGNLIVRLPGTIRTPRRLLMAHMDTVPICIGCEPTIDGELVRSANPQTGLGADNRSGCAVLLTAALEVAARGIPHPPLTFLWTVQEEVGLYGARLVRTDQLGSPKLCFNWDGDSHRKVTIGATGAYRMQIDVAGKASHAGVAPERGVSAVAIAALAIADLQRGGWHGLIRQGSKSGTSNIGPVAGGDATNVVAATMRLRAEARSHDPRFRERIVSVFRRAFDTAAKQVRSTDGARGRVAFQADLHYESFRLTEDTPVVEVAQRVLRRLGDEPELRISNGGLDANWLSARSFPTVTFGCGQRDVHTVSETLHIPTFVQSCRLASAIAAGVG